MGTSFQSHYRPFVEGLLLLPSVHENNRDQHAFFRRWEDKRRGKVASLQSQGEEKPFFPSQSRE